MSLSIKKLIENSYNRVVPSGWAKKSWAQEGEDLLLSRIFEGKKSGFYVDVGAHHPRRFSNTYLFYRLGWKGINIDAMPGSMKLFERLRPRDINLELGIALEEGSLYYYMFNEPALNGFSKELSEARNLSPNENRVTNTIQVDVFPLRKVLDDHADGRCIDFLTVDVEGLDLQVLKSNDWSRYRPRVVLAEVLNFRLGEVGKDPVSAFMSEQRYAVFAKQYNTVFYKDISDS